MEGSPLSLKPVIIYSQFNSHILKAVTSKLYRAIIFAFVQLSCLAAMLWLPFIATMPNVFLNGRFLVCALLLFAPSIPGHIIIISQVC